MGWVLLFAVIFGVGPLIFLRLVRMRGTRTDLWQLGLAAAAFVAASLALRFGFPGAWGQDVILTWVGMGLVWMAWIVVLALGALALRRADPGVAMRRWTGVIGAMGTTVPWFGLASAQLLGS